MACTLNVMARQLFLASFDVYDLLGFGATHSFISRTLALSIGNSEDKVLTLLRMVFPSGEVLMSEFCLKHVLITINSVELRVDLKAIEMKNFDVILGMDFWKNIDRRQRRVIFKPYIIEEFMFERRSLRKPKMIISTMQA